MKKQQIFREVLGRFEVFYDHEPNLFLIGPHQFRERTTPHGRTDSGVVMFEGLLSAHAQK